jgi:hypothetical protein
MLDYSRCSHWHALECWWLRVEAYLANPSASTRSDDLSASARLVLMARVEHQFPGRSLVFHSLISQL